MTKSDELWDRLQALYAQGQAVNAELNRKTLNPFRTATRRWARDFQAFVELVNEHARVSAEWEAAIRQEFFDRYGYDPFDEEGVDDGKL